MLEETFILSKLPLTFEKGENISIHVLSSFIYILNISVKKQVFLYIYSVRQSKESTFELVWHDPALTVDSYFVSPDGYLFILTANNDLHFYNVVEQEVFLERELLSSEFMELLKYSGFPMKNAQFLPLSLVGNNLVLCSGTRWLIVVTWNFSAKVAKDFMVSCIDLGPSITSITSNKQYIFCLNSYGDILVHKAVDALFLIRLSVSDWLPWKDVDNTTQSHRRMVALGCGHDRMRLALVAATHDQVAILDLAAAFNDAMNLNVDSCSSISSEKSHKTTASSYSATSKTSATSGFSSQAGTVNASSKQLFNYNVFNDAWSNYLQNLKKSASPGQAQSSSHARNLANDVVKLNLSPDFGEIRKVHATDRGISVLSRLDASTYLYRLFDSRSGQLKFRASLPSYCEVVALTASDVTIDLVVADNSLRLPLCGAPKHVFLNKLLRCVDESRIALLLEGWDEMRSPVTLLLASVADGQLDNVHLALNLHAQLFKLEASGQEVGEGAQTWEILDALDGVVSDTLKATATNVGDIPSATRVDDLSSAMTTNVDDSSPATATKVDDSSSTMTTNVDDCSSATATQVGDTSSATATRVSDKFVRQIRGLQLTHCYRLLSLLDEIAIPMQAKAKAAVLRHKIQQLMFLLFCNHCYQGMVSKAVNLAPQCRMIAHSLGLLAFEMGVWAGIDRLSAVHCFLAVRRQWTPPELGGARFRELATNAAQHLANNQDLDGAVHLLQHATTAFVYSLYGSPVPYVTPKTRSTAFLPEAKLRAVDSTLFYRLRQQTFLF
ncbi:uncharacterized protein LOC120352431 [Nilaparvata lugens]|uniref:uncharacterized protein LOC120352431 n=1 Tax=Nilaparvata lugens TaxID=108931 RepID=UPI00193D9CB1|nr:uncharacterized protein LOC120352431 [Nilaparvata lugens]